MTKAQNKSDGHGKRYLFRDEKGRIHGVDVVDPGVRPKGVSVTRIMEAVKKVRSGALRKQK